MFLALGGRWIVVRVGGGGENEEDEGWQMDNHVVDVGPIRSLGPGFFGDRQTRVSGILNCGRGCFQNAAGEGQHQWWMCLRYGGKRRHNTKGSLELRWSPLLA
jgi:hypothetical protein